MSIEENKTAFRRWIDGLNSGNCVVIDRLVDELFTDDYTYRFMAQPPEVRSHEFMKNMLREALKNAPDTHFIIDDMIVEGDRLVVRMTTSRSNRSTGKLERNLLIEFRRLADGKFVETWGCVATAD